jgi:hypothetical protein
MRMSAGYFKTKDRFNGDVDQYGNMFELCNGYLAQLPTCVSYVIKSLATQLRPCLVSSSSPTELR